MSVFRKLPPIVPVVEVKIDKPYMPVSLTQSADDFLADQVAGEKLLIELSVIRKQLNRAIAQNTIMSGLLSKHLDAIEAAFDNDERFPSPEDAQDYLDSAIWMRDNYSRKYNRIDDVQRWLNNYLPFNN